ncbi:MAG: tetratricopeptide repeat protein [Vicinamibacteria bacterium]
MKRLPSRPNARAAAAAQLSRALGLERAGHREEAAEAYGQAVRLNPDDPEAQTRLGLVLRELGRDEEANRAFLSALRLREALAFGVR